MPSSADSSVRAPEIAHFSDLAARWWDKGGPFAQLHSLTPLRLCYIKERIAEILGPGKSLQGLDILDVGCGGGLVSEALAKEGAKVMGIDASAGAVQAAKAHLAKQTQALDLDYAQTTAEKWAEKGHAYEVIIAFEILEHVANLPLFMKSLSSMLRPGGVLLMATLNRTRLSYLLAVVGAEYILGWVPPGTHDWDSFLKPSELADYCEEAGLSPESCMGMVYQPFSRQFVLKTGKVAVNYFMTAVKVEKDTAKA